MFESLFDDFDKSFILALLVDESFTMMTLSCDEF